MKKILITGFEAFLGETLNPSALLLHRASSFPGVDTLLLPVSFEKAFAKLQNFRQNKNYDAILMLGQAGGRAKISLERIAVNWRESSQPDNEAYLAQPGRPIDEKKDKAFFSTLPLQAMKHALESLRIPVEISFSAGAYVCNDLFFRTAEALQGQEVLCGFVHVPYLPEQTENKPGAPSLPLETMEKALEALIACVYQNPSEENDI
jgi:pyroglutamyl-peptidase